MQDPATYLKRTGVISRLVGDIVDVDFESGNLPEIHIALSIKRLHSDNLIVEIQEHVGSKTVRAIAMGLISGLHRGMPVFDLRQSIQMPISRQTQS